MQLHAARVAAGDPAAIALRDACAEAGVTICRYPVPSKLMKVGETLAASKLAGQLARYGRDTLVSALCCITKTGDGNVGFVRAPVAEALCAVLDSEPGWAVDRDALIAAMNSFDFAKAYSAAQVTAAKDRVGVAAPLVELIAEHLDRTMAAE
jgi:hypothetical protein